MGFDRRRRLGGFSLVELLMAVFILSCLLAMIGVNLRQRVVREGPRSLAYALAGDLRAARAEAKRSGKMVAFCLPSQGRTNSITRTAVVRRGSQRGHLVKVINYEEDFSGSIFAGTWPGSTVVNVPLPIDWSVSIADEVALNFRPDGTVFSNQLPALDGSYPLVVGSGFAGNLVGPSGTLTNIDEPHTIWVGSSGSVTLQENQIPAGTLPGGGVAVSAAPAQVNEPSPSTPTLVDVALLPREVDGGSGISQNFVSVHPNLKEGGYLEYGLVTIEVKARDSDGGPLFYTLTATASSGDAGNFTVSNLEGQLNLVYDQATAQHLWKAVVSWRPPPGTPPEVEYDLALRVSDPEGNSVNVTTSAGLLPTVSSLPPARMVIASAADQLYLTNLDGANEVRITHAGPEVGPFFSRDGTRIFSFHDVSAAVRELRSRPADGTISFRTLATFPSSAVDITFDPSFNYAALRAPAGMLEFEWGRVDEHSSDNPDGSSDTSYSFAAGANSTAVDHIRVLNLMSNDPPITLTDRGYGDFFWASNARHTLYLGERTETPEVSEHGYGPFHQFPGFLDSNRTLRLVGYPPSVVPSGVTPIRATGKIFNPADPDWYLKIEGSSLHLRNEVDPSVDRVVHSAPGGFENAANQRRIPSWSGDGERVTFVTAPGAGSKVVAMRVLDPSFQPLGSFSQTYEFTAADLSSAQLSPEGRWVYFLRGGNLYRVDNSNSATPVNISQHLGITVAAYAISP